MGLKIDFKFEISALVIRIFFEINFSNLARAAVSSPALVVTDGGGWVPKMFSDFAETLHNFSTLKVILFILGIKPENFLMGLKIDFKFEILEILVQKSHR